MQVIHGCNYCRLYHIYVTNQRHIMYHKLIMMVIIINAANISYEEIYVMNLEISARAAREASVHLKITTNVNT